MAAVLDRYRPFLEAHRPLSRRVRLHHIRVSVSAKGPAGVMTTLPCPAGYSWHRPAASPHAAPTTSSEHTVLTDFDGAGTLPHAIRGIPGGFGGQQQPQQQPGRAVSNRLPNGKLGEAEDLFPAQGEARRKRC